MPEDELMSTAEDQVNPSQSQASADQLIWEEVIKLQLNGVMMHNALLEECSLHELLGCATLHKYHAEEEFGNYLHVIKDYIELYKTKPNTSNVSIPMIKLVGTTTEEKIISELEHYLNWEKRVYASLKDYKWRLTTNKEHMDWLLYGVQKEIKCINLMMNDILDGKCSELENWLLKRYGDEC